MSANPKEEVLSSESVKLPLPHEFNPNYSDERRIDYANTETNIDESTIADMKAIMARYPQPRSALLPMLHLVQSVDGYISAAGVELCADLLGIPVAQVNGVATFYTQYHRKPAGEYHVGVCTTSLCAIMGGDVLLGQMEQKLGIEPGETTPDGKFSLERGECNAACDFAPVMMVNWEFMDAMTPELADKLIDDLRAGRDVHSTRGPRIPTFKENERMLAGFCDGLADEGPSAGDASLRGVKLAKENGWRAPSAAEVAAAKPADEEAAK